jgi:hypothetical protein
MMPRAPAGLLALLMVSISLAGCTDLFGGAKEFSPIEAPDWEAGYSWSYHQAQRIYESRQAGPVMKNSPADVSESDVEMRVFNTTAPYLGEDVYYVRVVDDDFDGGPFLEAPLMVLSKGQLSIRATGYPSGDAPHPAEPMLSYAPYNYPATPAWTDPCNGQETVYDAEGGEHLAYYRFPLESGRSWTGNMGGNEFSIPYKFTVGGLEKVQTPAGEFNAARVTMRSQDSKSISSALFSVDIQMDYWWAREVRNVVRSDVLVQYTSGFGGETYRGEFHQRSELTGYSLVAGNASPAPLRWEEVVRAKMEDRAWQIEADSLMPVNLSAGPAKVTFGLRSDASGGNWDGNPTFDAYPAGPELDPKKHSVLWTMTPEGYPPYSFSNPAVKQVLGPTATFEIPMAMAYGLSAEVVPLVCGEPRLGSASGRVSTLWTDTYSGRQSAAPSLTAQNVFLGRFDVTATYANGRLSYDMQRAASGGLLQDSGTLQLKDSYGMTVGLFNEGARTYGFLAEGNRGPYSVYFQYNSPVIFGELVTARVSLVYGDSHFH